MIKLRSDTLNLDRKTFPLFTLFLLFLVSLNLNNVTSCYL